jgi:thiamine pyrophosphokinase
MSPQTLEPDLGHSSVGSRIVKAVIVADGEHAPADSGVLGDAELIIAADGGAAWLDAQGIAPHLLIGDLDSVDPGLVDRLTAARVSIERHSVDKDASDLELGVAAARKVGADEIVVLGALGGALDHLLANVLLLGSTDLAGRSIRLVHGSTSARLLTGPAEAQLDGPIGARVSLLAVGPGADGVTTRGLRWPLAAERLELGSSRGLANAVEAVPAGVSLVSGRLLVVEVVEGADGEREKRP